MKKIFYLASSCLMAIAMFSCEKDSTEVSVAEVIVGSKFTGDTLKAGSSIKGTIPSRTAPYYMTGDVTVNEGDTLYIQKGVKIIVIGNPSSTSTLGQATNNPTFFIKGSLLVVGTQDAPVEFTINDNLKGDQTTLQDPATDPAFKGYWGGFNCDAANLAVFKWAKVAYVGGPWGANPPTGYSAGDPKYGISYLASKTNATLVVEDSYFYGSVDDCIRTQNVKLSIMRSKFAKTGKSGGEAINMKDGSIGDVAFNLFVGGATNGVKAASVSGTTHQTNINTYNNTILNTGYRQTKQGRGGSINYEILAKGNIYNNMIINCHFGLRLRSPEYPDTTNIKYGYQYYYGATSDLVAEFNAATTGSVTRNQATDVKGGVGENDPSFKSFALNLAAGTTAAPSDEAKRTNFFRSTDDLKLNATSKALNKGYTGFSPINSVANLNVNGIFKPTVSNPGKDAGAYQADNSGNLQ